MFLFLPPILFGGPAMANLDTRNKRASAIGYSQPWLMTVPLPVGPLATVAARRQILHGASPGSVTYRTRRLSGDSPSRTRSRSAA